MSAPTEGGREGSLQAPTRHPIAWQESGFYDQENLFKELERVFDICHGCRRCFSLCNAFPTLFNAIDASDTMELDGVSKQVYWDVVDQCYLCDMCFMTKCPYVPPHVWNVDFPHLMLRAKAVKCNDGEVKIRDRILTATDRVGALAGIPIVVQTVNAANKNSVTRSLLQKTLGVHTQAVLPRYHSSTLRKRFKRRTESGLEATPAAGTTGKVALFVTCYGNYNEPELGEDLIAVERKTADTSL